MRGKAELKIKDWTSTFIWQNIKGYGFFLFLDQNMAQIFLCQGKVVKVLRNGFFLLCVLCC